MYFFFKKSALELWFYVCLCFVFSGMKLSWRWVKERRLNWKLNLSGRTARKGSLMQSILSQSTTGCCLNLETLAEWCALQTGIKWGSAHLLLIAGCVKEYSKSSELMEPTAPFFGSKPPVQGTAYQLITCYCLLPWFYSSCFWMLTPAAQREMLASVVVGWEAKRLLLLNKKQSKLVWKQQFWETTEGGVLQNTFFYQPFLVFISNKEKNYSLFP